MMRCADYLLGFSNGIPLATASGSSIPHLSFSASAVTFLGTVPGVVPCFHTSLSSGTLCRGLLVFLETAKEHRGGAAARGKVPFCFPSRDVTSSCKVCQNTTVKAS